MVEVLARFFGAQCRMNGSNDMTYTQRGIIFCAAIVLMCGASATFAATLSKNELALNEFISIEGGGFGSLNETSYICFDLTSKCFGHSAFTTHTGFHWSDERITFRVPLGIPGKGFISVYNLGRRDDCSSGRCIVKDVIEEKARLSYITKPIIASVSPLVPKRGDDVTIRGSGFGSSGSVLFDDFTTAIIRWSEQEIVVRAPSDTIIKTIEVRTGGGQILRLGVFSYLDQIKARATWSSMGSSPVIVAVIDDGLYVNHPGIRDHVWINEDEQQGNGRDDDNNGYVDDRFGYNFFKDNANVDPQGIHGTHVANTVLNVAGSGSVGTNQAVRIMPLVVASSSGSALHDAVLKAIRYAVDNGAHIINLSLGSGGTVGYLDSYTEAIQYAYGKGVIVVAAAGNDDTLSRDGQDLNQVPQSPVCNNNKSFLILGVAALDNSDMQNNGAKRARWSSYGSVCVSIAAPGEKIPGAVPVAFSADQQSYYELQSGTSFAAPIVSGAAAVLKATHPEWKNWEIMNRLRATTENIDDANRDHKGQIGGRLNMLDALSRTVFDAIVEEVLTPQVSVGTRMRVRISNLTSAHRISLATANSSTPLDLSSLTTSAGDIFEFAIPSELKEGEYTVIVVPGSSSNSMRVTLTPALAQVVPTPSSPPQSSIMQPAESQQQPTFTPPSFSFTTISSSAAPPSTDFVQREKKLVSKIDTKLVNRLKGKIVLQVQNKGEAWYIDPASAKRYYLKDGAAAFALLRRFGLGITNVDIAKISIEGTVVRSTHSLSERLKGRILLQTQSHGESWYINPITGLRHYLRNGDEAYRIMRNLGLGITTADVRKIPIGE